MEVHIAPERAVGSHIGDFGEYEEAIRFGGKEGTHWGGWGLLRRVLLPADVRCTMDLRSVCGAGIRCGDVEAIAWF